MKNETTVIISDEHRRLEVPAALVQKYKNLINIRRIGDVRWDEISKSPEEAKICWEVAVEEIRDHREIIRKLERTSKDLKRKVTRLKSIVRRKKSALKIKKEQSRHIETQLSTNIVQE